MAWKDLTFFYIIGLYNSVSFVLRRSKRLLVPANTISRVIGRGGCNINAVRDISTAQVEIDRSRDSTTERIITIK